MYVREFPVIQPRSVYMYNTKRVTSEKRNSSYHNDNNDGYYYVKHISRKEACSMSFQDNTRNEYKYNMYVFDC